MIYKFINCTFRPLPLFVICLFHVSLEFYVARIHMQYTYMTYVTTAISCAVDDDQIMT